MCYERICQHHNHDQHPTLRGYLVKKDQATIAHISKNMSSPNGGYFAHAGWYELLAQLIFLKHIGMV